VNKATEWTPSPRDFRTTIATTIGKVDANNAVVVDFRSEKAIKASNSITAYSLTRGAK